MIDQVLSMKKRYNNLVAQFVYSDFEGWFAEFFSRYPDILEVTWFQEDPTMTIKPPRLLLSPSYLKTHTELRKDTEDGWWDAGLRLASDKEVRRTIWCAAKDVQHLMSATDVLWHVFGDNSTANFTREKLTVTTWDKGTSYVTSTDKN
jgi:hypothetical protein